MQRTRPRLISDSAPSSLTPMPLVYFGFAWLRGACAPSRWASVLLAGFLLFVSGVAHGRDVPPLTARVNDTAGLLSATSRQRLEQRLAQYEGATGQQFALLTIDTLAGDALEDFSIRTVEAWKLGKKGVDEGLLLLVVRDDRKVRIEVGYGLEGSVTDAVSSRVIREVIQPAFRRSDYSAGIEGAFERLMQAASPGKVPPAPAGTPQPAPARGQGRSSGSIVGLVLFLLFFVLPLLGPLGFRGRRRRSFGAAALGGLLGGLSGSSRHHGGGSWGGGGGFGGGGFGGGGGGFGGGGASGSW